MRREKVLLLDPSGHRNVEKLSLNIYWRLMWLKERIKEPGVLLERLKILGSEYVVVRTDRSVFDELNNALTTDPANKHKCTGLVIQFEGFAWPAIITYPGVEFVKKPKASLDQLLSEDDCALPTVIHDNYTPVHSSLRSV